MERFVTDYSVKNIPIPSKHQYKIQLILKSEKTMKRMRWKCLECLGKLTSNNVKSYGFKSVKCSPSIQEMTDFENDLQQIIKSVKFRQISNSFQGKLKKDIEHIKKVRRFLFLPRNQEIYTKSSKKNTKSY